MLGALMVALGEGAAPESVHIATFAWERTRFDPQPGPRTAADFCELGQPAPGVWQIGTDSRLRRGHSFLPTVVRETGCQLYLLDPSSGVVGLRNQLSALACHVASEATLLVDVGGDILAKGGERGLRSPTADAMALAATEGIGQAVAVLALGMGLDGELTRKQWREAWRSGLRAHAATERPQELDRAAAVFVRKLLGWHPSEVAGLACMAALGYRGTAEVRAEGLLVRIDDDAAYVHRFRHEWVLARNRVARAIAYTDRLEAVVAIVRRMLGRSELDEEIAMHSRHAAYTTRHLSGAQIERLESRLMRYSEQAAQRQVSFLTLRRVSELLALSPRPFAQLCRHLTKHHPERIAPPVWRCDG